MSSAPRLERASWIAGIASAVVAIVGLYALFKPSTPDAPSRQVNLNTGSGTLIGTATGPVTINQGAEAHESDGPVDIVGRWSDEAATALAKSELKKTEPRLRKELCETGQECQIIHHLIGKYSLTYASKDVALLLYASNEAEMTCHACAPYISIIEFERRPTGWRHTQSDLAVFQWGSWGNLDAASVDARPIGPNLYGIVFNLSYSGMGETAGTFAIWAKRSDSYQMVLDIPSSYSDDGTNEPGRYEWKAQITFEHSDTGLYPISVTATGVNDRKRINSVTRFEYNGIEYRAENIPEYLTPRDCIQKDPNGKCDAEVHAFHE